MLTTFQLSLLVRKLQVPQGYLPGKGHRDHSLVAPATSRRDPWEFGQDISEISYTTFMSLPQS